jgi:hypothetical protein
MIPKVKLEHLELSRFFLGTNPFCGISHKTPSQDIFYKEYFSDVDKISEIMMYLLEEFGVNAFVSSPRDNLDKARNIVEKEMGEKYYWICTPSDSRLTAKGTATDLKGQIQWCADHNSSICMPHRSWTDSALDPKNNRIRDVEKYLDLIRDLDMIPGLSSHYYETIRACNTQKYDVKLIIQPLNTLGFMSNIEVNTLIQYINNTSIQILNIKPLAAGRLLPEVGLNFCFNNIKSNDFVACGVDCLQNGDYDAQIVEELLSK